LHDPQLFFWRGLGLAVPRLDLRHGARSGDIYFPVSFGDGYETDKTCRNFAKRAGTQLSPDLHSGLGVGRKHLCKRVFDCGGHIHPVSPARRLAAPFEVCRGP
jgi:hypothetical protein